MIYKKLKYLPVSWKVFCLIFPGSKLALMNFNGIIRRTCQLIAPFQAQISATLENKTFVSDLHLFWCKSRLELFLILPIRKPHTISKIESLDMKAKYFQIKSCGYEKFLRLCCNVDQVLRQRQRAIPVGQYAVITDKFCPLIRFHKIAKFPAKEICQEYRMAWKFCTGFLTLALDSPN